MSLLLHVSCILFGPHLILPISLIQMVLLCDVWVFLRFSLYSWWAYRWVLHVKCCQWKWTIAQLCHRAGSFLFPTTWFPFSTEISNLQWRVNTVLSEPHKASFTLSISMCHLWKKFWVCKGVPLGWFWTST